MWLSRPAYDAMRRDYDKAIAEARILGEQLKVANNTLDWLRIRVSQLEMERAQLLFNYTGVKTVVPSIEKRKPSPNEEIESASLFNDVGDKEAERLGITHDPYGLLQYNEK